MTTEGRLLPLSRPAAKTEQARNLVVHFTSGKTLELRASSWGDLTDGEDSVVWVGFYLDKKCIAQLPAVEIRAIVDADALDHDAVAAALKKPARRKRAKKTEEK